MMLALTILIVVSSTPGMLDGVLLHDAIEEQGAAARERIRDTLGQAVLDLVEACSESETFPKPPWRERKEAYLKLVEAMRRRLAQLEQESAHPTLVSLRLLIEEYAEVTAALAQY